MFQRNVDSDLERAQTSEHCYRQLPQLLKISFQAPANQTEELWPSEEASSWTPGKPQL